MFDNFFRSISQITSFNLYEFATKVELAAKNINIAQNPFIVLDILLAAILIYFSLVFLKKIRMLNLFLGVLIIILLYFLAHLLNLVLVLVMIRYFSLFLIVVIPFFVIPTLRRSLDRIELEIGGVSLRELGRGKRQEVIDEISRAIRVLAEKRAGALIILENKDDLAKYIETGKKIEAKVSAEFLVNIFFASSFLRKGATIIRGDEILASKCLLPVSKRKLELDSLNPKDRAALGLSEVADALCFVTSAERGNISIAHEGSFITDVEPERLESIIMSVLSGKEITRKIDIR